jgi:hypothetical protein
MAAIDVSPGLIDQTGVTFDITVEVAQPNTVTMGFIDQQAQLASPSVRQPTKALIQKVGIYDPIIQKTGIYEPTISKRGIYLS